MDMLFATILGGMLLLLGVIGCVVPVLPGPLCAYAALWVLVVFGVTPGTTPLVVGAGVLVVAMIADYVFPALCARKFKCSKMGVFGCFVGTIVGLFFLPIGLVVGPFLGTVCGELIAGQTMDAALKGGVGALCGFVICMVLKFSVVAMCAYWFIARILSNGGSVS